MAIPSTLLLRFFLEKGPDTHTACLGSKVTAESISTSETPATSPVATIFEIAAADELLLSRVQTLVSLAVVLTGKRLAADAAHERSLICVCTQMRSKVVGACKSLGT